MDAPQPPTPKRGRPTKFDAKKAASLCAKLRKGMHLCDAAALAGVDVRTVQRWVALGEGDEAREPFKSFAFDVAVARAKFVEKTTGQVLGGRDSDRGKRWLLEKLRPRQFGERVMLEVQSTIDDVLARLKGGLTADEYAKVLRILSGEEGAGGAPSPASDPV